MLLDPTCAQCSNEFTKYCEHQDHIEDQPNNAGFFDDGKLGVALLAAITHRRHSDDEVSVIHAYAVTHADPAPFNGGVVGFFQALLARKKDALLFTRIFIYVAVDYRFGQGRRHPRQNSSYRSSNYS